MQHLERHLTYPSQSFAVGIFAFVIQRIGWEYWKGSRIDRVWMDHTCCKQHVLFDGFIRPLFIDSFLIRFAGGISVCDLAFLFTGMLKTSPVFWGQEGWGRVLSHHFSFHFSFLSVIRFL
jgi:hypothetical protein